MTTETQAPDPADEMRADFERELSSHLSPLHLLSLERDPESGRYLDPAVFGAWWGYCNAAATLVAIPAPEGAPMTLPPPDTHCFDDDTGRDVWSYSADLVRSIVSAALAAPAPQADEVLIAIKRGEDYQDVHPELVAADALGNTPFEWRVIDAAPQTKESTNDR